MLTFILFVLPVVQSYINSVNYSYLLPDYEIPKWVYKKVFNYNKVDNIQDKIQYNLKKNTFSYESDINIDDIHYNTIEIVNLPFGLLQPINDYQI